MPPSGNFYREVKFMTLPNKGFKPAPKPLHFHIINRACLSNGETMILHFVFQQMMMVKRIFLLSTSSIYFTWVKTSKISQTHSIIYIS